MEDKFFTVGEAAAYLRVSEATILRWCRTKRLRAFKIGREWRIPCRLLIALAEADDPIPGEATVVATP